MSPRRIAMLLALLLALVIFPILERTGQSLRAESEVQVGDDPATLQTLRPLAEKGDERAQYQLGEIFERGVGVPRSGAQAVHWYELSARRAYMPAERALGLLYLEGRLVPQDYDAARNWLERAAHDGSDRAQYELGKLLEHGYNRAPDLIMAYVWYDFAAAQGNTEARKARDILATKLPSDHLEEAQRITTQIAPSVLGAGR